MLPLATYAAFITLGSSLLLGHGSASFHVIRLYIEYMGHSSDVFLQLFEENVVDGNCGIGGSGARMNRRAKSTNTKSR